MKKKIPVNLQEVEPALWSFQCTKSDVVWKGTKTEGNKNSSWDSFLNFNILISKRVVVNYTSTVLKKKHKNERLWLLRANVINLFVYTPAVVLNSPFIQITALSHHEKAPLCCTIISWNVSEFRVTTPHRLAFTDARGRSEMHLPTYSAVEKVN